MCVLVCARVGMEGVQAMRRPSPSPTHRCCLSQVPQKKTTRCCKTLLVRCQPHGWSTEPQAARPTGVVHGCACARAQRTLTHDPVGAAFAHVCLCHACVMYTQPHSSEFRWFTPTQRWGFPDSSAGKDSACNAGDPGSIPGSDRFPGEGQGYALQNSGLENSMDCIVHGVAKSDKTETFTFTQRWPRFFAPSLHAQGS